MLSTAHFIYYKELAIHINKTFGTGLVISSGLTRGAELFDLENNPRIRPPIHSLPINSHIALHSAYDTLSCIYMY